MKRLLLLLFCLFLCQSAQCQSMDEIKNAPYLAQVMVSGAVTYLEPLECYIESTERDGGIWVQASMAGIQIGDVITATGTYSYIEGEAVLANADIYPQGIKAGIAPFGMCNSFISGFKSSSFKHVWDHYLPPGAFAYSWKPASGAYNTGLLVKTWGTINASYDSAGTRWFYVDDGHGVVSDYGDKGVLVYSDADVKIGDSVAVTGISSVEPSFDDPNRLIRVVRTRNASDIQLIREAPKPEYAFSDEFDGPTIDPRWGVSNTSPAYPNAISITPDKWLKLQIGNQRMSPNLSQRILSNEWDIEVKVRSEITNLSTSQAFGVNFNIPMFYSYYAVVEYNPTLPEASRKRVRLSGKYGEYYYPMVGDVSYLRFRARNNNLYFSVRFENTEYSEEVLVSELTIKPTISMFSITLNSYLMPVYYIDYFRFTRVSE